MVFWNSVALFDLEPLQDRIVLALELLQGGEIHPNYSLKQQNLKLFPAASRQTKARFPLIRNMRHPHPYQKALQSIAATTQNLDASAFEGLKLSVRLHLEAKSLNGKIDLSFLTSMIFVERNDLRRQVHEIDTARLLGTSLTASKIYNCLRDKLMHGRGGLESSYAEVLKEDFHNQPPPDLYKEFALKPIDQEHLFACIVFRLFERIDAYLWRQLIGAELEDVRRNTPYGLHSMPLPDLYLEAIGPKKTSEKLREEVAVLRDLVSQHQLQPPISANSTP